MQHIEKHKENQKYALQKHPAGCIITLDAESTGDTIMCQHHTTAQEVIDSLSSMAQAANPTGAAGKEFVHKFMTAVLDAIVPLNDSDRNLVMNAARDVAYKAHLTDAQIALRELPTEQQADAQLEILEDVAMQLSEDINSAVYDYSQRIALAHLRAVARDTAFHI